MNTIFTKEFWKATGVRCLRTFLTTILGVWTVGTTIVEIDWTTTLLSAASTTVYIFIVCLVAGIPEAEYKQQLEEIEFDKGGDLPEARGDDNDLGE